MLWHLHGDERGSIDRHRTPLGSFGRTDTGHTHTRLGLMVVADETLWTELGVERAMDYVVNGQGGEIPEFDEPRNRTRQVTTVGATEQDSPIRYRERY